MCFKLKLWFFPKNFNLLEKSIKLLNWFAIFNKLREREKERERERERKREIERERKRERKRERLKKYNRKRKLGRENKNKNSTKKITNSKKFLTEFERGLGQGGPGVGARAYLNLWNYFFLLQKAIQHKFFLVLQSYFFPTRTYKK